MPVDDGAANAHFGQVLAAESGQIVSGTVTCLEVPTTGVDDIDVLEPPPEVIERLQQIAADPTAGTHRYMPNAGFPAVVHYSAPLLLIRMKLMDLPDTGERAVELYRTLLELNATDVVHGAYGIEAGELILSDTLELETLDFHEIRASMESIEMAASAHMDKIRSMAGVEKEG